jgi:hypothetical protein
VSNLLKDSGRIIITTPNLDCFWSKSTLLLYKWFGIPWSSLTPPHHLFQFSTSGISKSSVYYELFNLLKLILKEKKYKSETEFFENDSISKYETDYRLYKISKVRDFFNLK